MWVDLIRIFISPEVSLLLCHCFQSGYHKAMFFKGTSGTTVQDQLWGANQERFWLLQLFFYILRFIYTISVYKRIS